MSWMWGPHQHLYCLEFDVALTQDPSRLPSPWHSWTTATIWDMVARGCHQCKGVHHPWSRLSYPVLWPSTGAPGRVLPAWGSGIGQGDDKNHHMGGAGLYISRFSPITIAEAQCAILMSCGMSKHQDQEGLVEMIWHEWIGKQQQWAVGQMKKRMGIPVPCPYY